MTKSNNTDSSCNWRTEYFNGSRGWEKRSRNFSVNGKSNRAVARERSRIKRILFCLLDGRNNMSAI